MNETWKILNTAINKKEKGSQYPAQFLMTMLEK